ncbi:Protein CBG21613 [Caenorhabditis briggsae]|uniref:MRG domain-containing protein n=3 Tax=Caenorhabditis briggsae TaxID=6238 RepID=A0AAE9JDZ7_CAEBR|nr:Protein CBG21613 [Caenorhabditis briggsae]ULT93512.1 hypothetical protein L3Y34_003183 [Caenorhabditis briggsae]UMM26778.1 hypothetical protein L5515_010339 [Caenorhabditis briggsae]CAP38365.1 Protein CBG21613 [Caenorhabditis briggsae]
MSPTPLFAVGELVGCVHGNHNEVYDAKITAISGKKGVEVYHVHFMGWNVRHDITIPVGKEDGVLMKRDQEEVPKKKIRKSTGKITAPKKQASEDHQMEDDEEERMAQVRLRLHKPMVPMSYEVPRSLAMPLVADMKLVKNGFLTKSPAKIPLDKIVEDYLASLPKATAEEQENHSFADLSTRFIVDFFNEWLGSGLLYETERSHYNLQIKQAKKAKVIEDSENDSVNFRASGHYGLIHLLRLFSKLPDFLELDSQYQVELLNKWVTKFAEFLESNLNRYYDPLADYEPKITKEELIEIVNSRV